MKKLICILLSLILVFTCLVGCSKNEATKESEDYITKIIGENILNRDLAEACCLNGIVKIDSITSGPIHLTPSCWILEKVKSFARFLFRMALG